jgi:PAS domain S-box-containing protein
MSQQVYPGVAPNIALAESEGRFRLMADAAPVMIWMSGPDKLCTYFNKPWLDFTGRPLQRQLGNGWSEGVHPDDLQRCLDTYVQAFDARQGFRMEYRLQRFDGEYRWILDTGVPQFEADGTFAGYIGSCIDITDQKRVEEALRESEARLRALLESTEEARSWREQFLRVRRATLMGEMAASIAHEVNQPLCAIVSNAQALQHAFAAGGCDRDEVRETLQDIIQDGQRASAVIARIRGFLQKAPAERSPVNVNDLIREMSKLMQAGMARREVVVKLELAEQVPPVLGDRVQLQQVILNLMTNSADAMERAPKESRALVIRSSGDGAGTAAVTVTDAGVGLDPRNSDRVFDAFFTTKPGSLGMGLAVCKSIVEAHGGKIWARPNDGPGATIEFRLPAIRGADA